MDKFLHFYINYFYINYFYINYFYITFEVKYALFKTSNSKMLCSRTFSKFFENFGT